MLRKSLLLFPLFFVGGCVLSQEAPVFERGVDPDDRVSKSDYPFKNVGKLDLGNLFGKKGAQEDPAPKPHIKVDQSLWQAMLDQATPFGIQKACRASGHIQTEWREMTEPPFKRFCLSLQAVSPYDVHVTVFREKKVGGTWTEEPRDSLLEEKVRQRILQRLSPQKPTLQQEKELRFLRVP